ncbi:MAG: hypothetical protein O7H40_01290 [Gammaproteobacteria bacterium]|nr:hypothetical protein [Gammaproteobacteria bacterium]
MTRLRSPRDDGRYSVFVDQLFGIFFAGEGRFLIWITRRLTSTLCGTRSISRRTWP